MKSLVRKAAGLMAALMLSTGSAAMAQSAPVEEGTYFLEGGSYQIKVEKSDTGLLVREPNKDSPYQAAGADRPNTYLYFNPNTGYTYGIRGVDNQTIEAFKDVAGNVPTRLKRLGGPPAPASSIRAIDPGPSGRPPEGAGADVARKYEELSRTDPANAQSWTACSAAALKRSITTNAEADAYGVQVAQMLRLIAVDSTTSPCPDAISQALWDKAKGIDDLGSQRAAPAPQATASPPPPAPDADHAEKLRLNADMAAKAATEADRIKAEKDAYAAALAETQRAQEQYRREREIYEAEAARVKAAQDAYDAEMARFRSSGGRTTPQ